MTPVRRRLTATALSAATAFALLAGVTGDVSAGSSTISDPKGDVARPAADILSASAEAKSNGRIYVSTVLDAYQDPRTHPNWVKGITGITWDIDVGGDGNYEYKATFANAGMGEIGGRISDASARPIRCKVNVSTDAAANTYLLNFKADCIGNPKSFKWRSTMIYDVDATAKTPDFVDDAPDSGAAKPVANPAYTPPVPTCRGVKATKVGTDGNDRIIGTAKRDVIVAKGGDDIVRGRGGNDLICLGGGSDTALGGNGRDEVLGGSGNDVIRGGNGDDDLRGDAGRDTLYGEKNDDILNGGAGADKAYGGGGADAMRGSFGTDLLKGGAGNDILDGGAHRDRCNGEGGRDTATSCEVRFQIP